MTFLFQEWAELQERRDVLLQVMNAFLRRLAAPWKAGIDAAGIIASKEQSCNQINQTETEMDSFDHAAYHQSNDDEFIAQIQVNSASRI